MGSDDTKFDIWVKKAKNNPLIAAVLIASAVAAAGLGIVGGFKGLLPKPDPAASAATQADQDSGLRVSSARLLKAKESHLSLLTVVLENKSDSALPVTAVVLHASSPPGHPGACGTVVPQDVRIKVERLPSGERVSAWTTLDGVLVRADGWATKSDCVGYAMQVTIPVEAVVPKHDAVIFNFRLRSAQEDLSTYQWVKVGTDRDSSFSEVKFL